MEEIVTKATLKNKPVDDLNGLSSQFTKKKHTRGLANFLDEMI